MTLNVVDALAAHARREPAATAILAPGASPLTYALLAEQIGATGRSLAEVGVGRDDRVAVLLANGPAMATTVLGVMANAIAAPLNPQYTAEELRFYLTDLRPSALVVGEAMETPARDVAASLDVPIVELRSDRGGSGSLRGAGSELGAGSQRGARADDVALLLHTSGTTSRPKLVPLTHANLSASAGNVAGTLGLAADDRCFNLMPLFHIHGLVAALLGSLESGGSVVCTAGFDPANVLSWMHELGPTWYTAVPTIHGAMLDALSQGSAVPPLRFIRSSSAALPTTTLAALEEAFGAPVIEAYGMTEAAHQMASNPRAGERKPGSVGPAAGPDIAILGDDGIVRGDVGQIGEIVIRGLNVMAGYIDNPEANVAAFVDGWFRTGDQGVLDGDGYVTITGRLKEIINRGGEKVAPTEVEEALLAHSDVDQATAFALAHPRLGEDVAAAVVLAADSTTSRAELRRFVAERLAPFKVPHRIVFVSDVPKGPTGKVQRIGLGERLGLEGPHAERPPFVEPRDDTERGVARIFADVLQLDAPISLTDDFVELGADSLHFEELLVEIERVFHRRLPASLFLEEATPERISVLLRADDGRGVATDPIVVPIQPGGSRPPLFCVMRAGTLVTARHFVSELGFEQPVFGIWMPAMHGDSDAAGGVEEIAASCRRTVAEVQANGPYYLFGYSIGGLVAYEMARQWASEDESTGLVVMADTPYPTPLPTARDRVAKLFSREGPPALARRLRGLARRLPPVRALTKPQPPHWMQRHVAEYAEVGVDLPATIHRERSYVGVPRPSAAPIVLLRSRITMELVCAGSPVLGWERYCDDDWEVHEVPGSHDSMLGEPHVHVLAATLSSCLLRAQERDSRPVGPPPSL
jgi:acyl-CoA synthetase (AMP-forming)/AMP-acid ligase II/thioesterase domain-containing protein/acyl carrier protein